MIIHRRFFKFEIEFDLSSNFERRRCALQVYTNALKRTRLNNGLYTSVPHSGRYVIGVVRTPSCSYETRSWTHRVRMACISIDNKKARPVGAEQSLETALCPDKTKRLLLPRCKETYRYAIATPISGFDTRYLSIAPISAN